MNIGSPLFVLIRADALTVARGKLAVKDRTALAPAAGGRQHGAVGIEGEPDRVLHVQSDGQAAGFVKHDGAYLDTVEALSGEQRDSLMIDLDFSPNRCRW